MYKNLVCGKVLIRNSKARALPELLGASLVVLLELTLH